MPRSLLSPLRSAYEASPPLVGPDDLRALLNNGSPHPNLPWYRTFHSRQLLGILMTLLGILALGYLLIPSHNNEFAQFNDWSQPSSSAEATTRQSGTSQVPDVPIVRNSTESGIGGSNPAVTSLASSATTLNGSIDDAIQGHHDHGELTSPDTTTMGSTHHTRDVPPHDGIPPFASQSAQVLRHELPPEHRTAFETQQSKDTESYERLYYLELNISLGGQYDIPRLQGQGTLPLQLSPGQSLSTAYVSIPSHSFASPSVELGTAVHRQSIWVYAGMEFHPSISEESYFPSNPSGASGALIREAAIRGYSMYVGTLFEQRIFGFFGLYGKAAMGYYNFEQTVIVFERQGAVETNTQHLASSRGIGGALGAGIYFNLWGVRIRAGLRSLYVGGNGSVSSSDFRLGIAYVM